MGEMLIAYIIWVACAMIFVVIGLYDICNADKGKVFGFYNMGPPPKAENLTDVIAYNRALGKLLIGAGVVFALIGLPLLFDSNAGIIVLVSMLGSVAWVIGMVLVYELKIMKKYRRKGR